MLFKGKKGVIIVVILIIIIISVIITALKFSASGNNNNNILAIRKTFDKNIQSVVYTVYEIKNMNDIETEYSVVKKNTDSIDSEASAKIKEFTDMWMELPGLVSIKTGKADEIFSQEVNYLGVEAALEYSDKGKSCHKVFIFFIDPSNNDIILQEYNTANESIPSKEVYIVYKSNEKIDKLIKDLIR